MSSSPWFSLCSLKKAKNAPSSSEPPTHAASKHHLWRESNPSWEFERLLTVNKGLAALNRNDWLCWPQVMPTHTSGSLDATVCLSDSPSARWQSSGCREFCCWETIASSKSAVLWRGNEAQTGPSALWPGHVLQRPGACWSKHQESNCKTNDGQGADGAGGVWSGSSRSRKKHSSQNSRLFKVNTV